MKTKHRFKIGDLVRIHDMYLPAHATWSTTDDVEIERSILKDQILEVVTLHTTFDASYVTLWCPARNITIELYEYT